jgi:glycosyltransferase involved in cell wall biosynthesis
MKILLIGNYQLDAIQSMDRFTSMLETHLTEFGHQVRVIRPISYFGRFHLSSQFIKKWLGYIDKLILFPSQLRQVLSWADVIHICDPGNAIYIKYLDKKPHVVTCHDLLAIRSGLGEFPEHQAKWTGKKLQKMIIKGLNQADQVVCVSEETRSDLLRLGSLDKSFVSCIPIGLNYPYTPMTVEKSKEYLEALGLSQNHQFILHVGGNFWYKNRLGVLEIFYQLTLKNKTNNFYLVMAGKPITQEMYRFIKKHNIGAKIIELVDIDNENLRALYSSATALLFPSLYEGFGWPIIEAQACGCPVFTSNRPPMNDVGGEAAIYLEVDNNYEKAAEKIIDYFPVLEEYKIKGLINCERFKINTMITQYIEIYKQVISRKIF